MKKVIPITGKHTTFSSMVADAMTRENATRGCVIFFEEDGTMHFGELGLERTDVGMMLMYIQMIGVQMMERPD
ncbi:MAG: hypothetical protein WCD70_15235 [Alphaproteobacteria bacterium]